MFFFSLGNSVPKYAISTLCSGGEEFTPLSSSACVVNALFSDPYKPVMDVDNDTGSLMMSIAGPNNNVSFFIYELTGMSVRHFASLFLLRHFKLSRSCLMLCSCGDNSNFGRILLTETVVSQLFCPTQIPDLS